jgi:hypothetical protein
LVVFQIREIYRSDDPNQILGIKGYLLKSSGDSNMELQHMLKKLDKDGIPGQVARFTIFDKVDICKKVGIHFIISMTNSDNPPVKLEQFIKSLSEIVEVTGNVSKIRLLD